MKKIGALFLAMVTVMLSLSSCGSSGNGKSPDTKEIADAVLAKVKQSEMVKLDEKKTLKFYNITSDDIESGCVYVSSSGAVADEITVFKAKDKSKISVIKDGISGRTKNRTDTFKDYVPAEISKINNNLVKTSGNYIIFVISSNSSEAEKVFDSYFQKK